MSNEVDLRKQRKVEASVTLDSTGLATEAKQDSQITLATLLNGYVDGIESLLTTLNAKDFATETTLFLIKGFVDGIETALGAIITNTTGLNLEATQLLVKGVLDNIKSKTDNLDVPLSTRSSEATLIQVRDYLDTVETKLQSIITVLPTSLGQKTSANSFPVVLPSDQVVSVTNASDTSASQSTSTIASSVTSVLLKAANANRHQITITNTSVKTLWICFFTPATSATPFFLGKNETWIFDEYTGAIYGIWDTGATGNAYITEETA
jgi:hypothetical protein